MRLETRALSFSYGGHPLLSEVNLKLDGGRITTLLGKNGAGKTTLIKLIMGFIRPAGGKVMINGEDASSLSSTERARLIAYIPQSTENTYSYTVLDSVLMGRSPHISLFSHPGKKDEEAAENAINMLGIGELKDRMVSTLSGGERQLVLIARALAQDAGILILDEPTSALDYSNQLLVMETLTSLRKQGYAILFSTHSPEQALMVSDSLILLEKGKKAEEKSPEELLDGSALSKLYGKNLIIRELDTGESRRIICTPE